MDKSTAISVYQVKTIRRDFNYKLTAADVFNEFLYIGDEKGNVYSYPVRTNDPDVISKNTNEQFKNITKYRIDKIECYAALSSIFILADEKLYVIDSALRKSDLLVSKVHDFAINQWSSKKQDGLHSVAVITKKKEGFIVFWNNGTKNYQQSKRFALTELPMKVGYTGSHIVCSYKRDYETYCVQKSFAMARGPIQAKSPFFQVTGPNEIVFFMDQVGLFMDPQFMPKQKDNITLTTNKPVIDIAITVDPKKCIHVQQINLSPAIRGITNNRPFIYGKDELHFLYQIPFQIQIKSLLEKCRVEEALALLIQNVGPDNDQKIQELRINSVWPLIKKMQFEKAKQIIKVTNFDIRELVLLYPELSSLSIQSLKDCKPDKFMNTLIIQFLNEKVNKSKDEQADLRKRSKLFLKDILDHKREHYASRTNVFKLKIQFNNSKYSLVKKKLAPATPEELLEIIDFHLIKWYLDMNMFNALQKFFITNPTIYCGRMFQEFENIIKTNQKLMEFPTLKPRLFAAFDRAEQAYEGWKFVAEHSQDQGMVNRACEQSVKLLTQFENKRQVYKKLIWILKKRPQIGMSFFSRVDLNFIPPEDIIRNFQDANQKQYLELYLEIIVLEKKTQIQVYHTKLLLLYLDAVFLMNPKENKEELKTPEFQAKLEKMRRLLRNPQGKYASQPILKRIQKCQWLLDDQIYLYAREKRHQEALRKYISKSKTNEAEEYCKVNKDGTLTIYFKLLLAMYKSYQGQKNVLYKKDIINFLKKYASDPQLDQITVLEMIPDDWLLSEFQGGIYQFLQSAIIHTLHQKRATYTSKHLSEMDLLNVQYNLIQTKKAYLRFTYKKKCCICQTPISDKYFVVYPNANVCHQACVKKEKNTICPITKQDFEKTFKY